MARSSSLRVALLLATAVVAAEWTFVNSPSQRSLPRARNVALRAAPFEHFDSEKAAAPAAGAVEEDAAGSFFNIRAMAAALVALLVAFAPLDSAWAARSGGRMGGGGFRSMPRASAPRAAPRTAPRATGSPNISVNVMPSPLGGGFFSPFGGFGVFGPPILPLPVPSFGPSGTDMALQNQQRNDERIIDQQKVEIEQMQRELAQLKAQKGQ